MNGDRQSVESPPISDERQSAIPLPVAERQGYHQFKTAPESRRGSTSRMNFPIS